MFQFPTGTINCSLLQRLALVFTWKGNEWCRRRKADDV